CPPRSATGVHVNAGVRGYWCATGSSARSRNARSCCGAPGATPVARLLAAGASASERANAARARRATLRLSAADGQALSDFEPAAYPPAPPAGELEQREQQGEPPPAFASVNLRLQLDGDVDRHRGEEKREVEQRVVEEQRRAPPAQVAAECDRPPQERHAQRERDGRVDEPEDPED